MKNTITCSNCQNENPFYSLICSNCKAFIRTKIPNIDLWFTIGKLLESPIEAIRNIIHSDHKNFVSLLLILAALKISLVSSIIANAFIIKEKDESFLISSLIFGGLLIIALIILISLLVTIINTIVGLKNRVRDNLAIYTYSFIPIILTFLILTPVEFALFGHYWFTFNPPPYIIKNTAALILMLIECVFMIWSCLLFILSTYVQSKNVLYSIIIGMLLFTLIFAVPMYLYSLNLF